MRALLGSFLLNGHTLDFTQGQSCHKPIIDSFAAKLYMISAE